MTCIPITTSFTSRAHTAFVLEKLGFNLPVLRYRVSTFFPPAEIETMKKPGERKYTWCNICQRKVRSASEHRRIDDVHKVLATGKFTYDPESKHVCSYYTSSYGMLMKLSLIHI